MMKFHFDGSSSKFQQIPTTDTPNNPIFNKMINHLAGGNRNATKKREKIISLPHTIVLFGRYFVGLV